MEQAAQPATKWFHQSSAGVLLTVDMAVQRCDGPRCLRDDDDEIAQYLPGLELVWTVLTQYMCSELGYAAMMMMMMTVASHHAVTKRWCAIYITNLFLLLSCCSSFPLTSCPAPRLEGLFVAFFIITLWFHFHFALLFVGFPVARLAGIQGTPASTRHMSLGSAFRRLQVHTVRLPVRVLCWLTKHIADIYGT